MINNGFFVLLSTCPDEQTAAGIARTLVEASLVACVNIVPGIRSIYRWQGSVEDDPEVLMILKTTGDRLEAARAGILELHPYEVPEVLALPVADGHHDYLSWVAEATRTTPR